VNGERKVGYLYIPCQGLLEMAGPMGEGGIRYWAVQSGRIGVEGGSIKEAGPVAVRLLCMFCLSRFSFSVCRRGFQAVLRIRPSSLFILFGCICISIASLMRRSEYPVLAERSLVSCSLMMWSRLKLC
jgi:hypothetical protein